MYTPGPLLGMHLVWWAFWIIAMVSVFGFNVPERARVNSLDPNTLLKRRLAKGEISEDEYNKISAHLRSDEVSAQREVNAQANHIFVVGHPIVDGLSFSATWAILYSLCSALYWIAPEAMMTAMSKLFHGMSFNQMAQAGTSFGFVDFISVLTIGAIYIFAGGIIWSFIHSYFLRSKAERRLDQVETRRVHKSQLSPQAR